MPVIVIVDNDKIQIHIMQDEEKRKHFPTCSFYTYKTSNLSHSQLMVSGALECTPHSFHTLHITKACKRLEQHNHIGCSYRQIKTDERLQYYIFVSYIDAISGF